MYVCGVAHHCHTIAAHSVHQSAQQLVHRHFLHLRLLELCTHIHTYIHVNSLLMGY